MTVLQLIETVVSDIEKYMPTWHLTHEYIIILLGTWGLRKITRLTTVEAVLYLDLRYVTASTVLMLVIYSDANALTWQSESFAASTVNKI